MLLYFWGFGVAFGFVWFCCFGGWEELCFVYGDLILCFFFVTSFEFFEGARKLLQEITYHSLRKFKQFPGLGCSRLDCCTVFLW